MAAIVAAPFFQTGFIQTLDMPWGPNGYTTDISHYNWLLFSIMQAFSNLTNQSIAQKAIISIILLLSLSGIHSLVRETSAPKLFNKPARHYYITTAIFLFNPFFYTRLISGQWLVLCGYALLPWAVHSIYLFLQNPKLKTAWPVAAWTAAIGLTSIHTLGIVALVGVALIIYSGRDQRKAKLQWLLAIAGVWVAINAIWLVPFILGQSSTAQDVASFSHSQMVAFETKGTVAGSVPLSAALLTGFWADDQNRYILPSSLPIWWVGVAILFSIISFGIFLVIKRRDRLGITFLILGVIAWLLGMGIAWPPSAIITDVLIKIVPVYNGYREPQKWLMLLALVYVYFLAIGASRLYEFVKAKWKSDIPRYAFITLLVIAPFLYAPTLAWGAAGQLKSVDYPKGWYDAKAYLNSHTSDQAKVLVLPWHIYLPLSWVGRVVANPAPYFFDQQMVTSDDFELTGVPPQGTTPTKTYVSNYIIPNITVLQNTGAKLKPYDISYVLLEKEADYTRYEPFLNRQKDMTRVYDNKNISIYKITTQ